VAIGRAIPPLMIRSTDALIAVFPGSTPARWHNSPQLLIFSFMLCCTEIVREFSSQW
jgi:hypothetical protein